MSGDLIYKEELTSARTTALFVGLSGLFLILTIWRVSAVEMDWLGIILLILCLVFTFYVVNYRILEIQISPKSLKLRFGIFSWTVPGENIAGCERDEIPAWARYGGAGIHFFMSGGRYRASFNFLEYPRVVIWFKQKKGPVEGISFSTQQADEVLRLVHELVPGL